MELICNLGENSGAMGVRWCLSEADTNRIKQDGLVDLTVVIDVFYNPFQDRTRDRIVVPVSEYMRFLTFRHPGVARVCAMLIGYPVSMSEHERRGKRSSLTEIAHGHFAMRLFEFTQDRERRDEAWGYHTEAGYDVQKMAFGGVVVSLHTVDVEVPESYFAKPWPAAIDWWVTWIPRTLLRRKLWDECDRRKWALASIIVQPPLFVVAYALLALAMSVLFLFYWCEFLYIKVWRGYRGVSFDKPPLPHTVWDAESPAKQAKEAGWSSVYLHDDDGNWLPWWRQWLQPAGVMLIGGASVALYTQSWVGFIALYVSAVGLLGMWYSLRYQVTGYDYRTGGEAKAQAKAEREAAERQAEQDQALALAMELSCPMVGGEIGDLSPAMATVAAVPRHRRSVPLRLAELKARVCRPMRG
jgi:hypothetical protein